MKTAIALSLAAAIVVALPGPPAWADKVTLRKAETLFRRGAKAYRGGDFQKAVTAFRASLERVEKPATMLNIAQCYRQLKDADKALLYYKQYLAAWDKQQPGTPAPHAEEVREHVAALTAVVERAKLAARRPRAVAPRPAAPQRRPAARAPAPQAAPRLSPAELTARPAPRRRLWTWVTGGTALVAAGVGLGLGLSAESGYDEYQTTDNPARFDALSTSVPARGHAATALFAVAGALAATSVVLFIVEGRVPKEQRAAGAATGSGLVVGPLAGSSWGLAVGRGF